MLLWYGYKYVYMCTYYMCLKEDDSRYRFAMKLDCDLWSRIPATYSNDNNNNNHHHITKCQWLFFQVSDPALAAMGYDQSADVWSLGVVLWHVWMNHDVPVLLVRWHNWTWMRPEKDPWMSANFFVTFSNTPLSKETLILKISHANFQHPKACFHAACISWLNCDSALNEPRYVMPLVCNIINGPSGKGTSIPKVGHHCDSSLVVCVCVFSSSQWQWL